MSDLLCAQVGLFGAAAAAVQAALRFSASGLIALRFFSGLGAARRINHSLMCGFLSLRHNKGRRQLLSPASYLPCRFITSFVTDSVGNCRVRFLYHCACRSPVFELMISLRSNPPP